MTVDRQVVPSALSQLGLKLNFFKLIVTDLPRMIEFYVAAFGFEIRNRVVMPGLEEVMLALPAEQFNLVLYHWTDGREIQVGNAHGPVGLITRDVDSAFAHAIAHGAIARRPPFDLPGTRIAFLADPEGHEIELITFSRAAAQQLSRGVPSVPG